MRTYIFVLLFLNAFTAFCQPWYSKIIDPFDGKQESAVDLLKYEDTILIRAYGACSNKLCTTLGKYSIIKNELSQARYLNTVEGGFSALFRNGRFILSSEDKIQNEIISVSQINNYNLSYISGLDLKISDNRYLGYTIKRSIEFNNKFFLGCQVLDNQTYINYPGWYNYQENAVFFVLDENLQTDTILIIPPSSGAHLRIEDLAIGPDSILYVSFFEKYLKSDVTVPYLEIRKVIYGFDKHYSKVFQWTGPDLDIQESWACLAIGPDSTIFMNYKRDYRSILMAIKSDGSVQWECLLDSTIGWNLYNIRKIILADNGDIVGTGIISSAVDELGESAFLFRVDPDGLLKWKKAIRVNKGFDLTVPSIFPYQTGLEDLAELPNGDLIAVGTVRKYVGNTLPDGPYNFDIWIVRTNSEGCLWEDCPYIQDVVTKDSYIPVVTPLNEWVVDYDPLSPGWPSEIRRYTFAADSVLKDGKYYHELRYSKNMSGGPWLSENAFLREEEGKTFKWLANMPEQLIYDFNLGIGDSITGGVNVNQATRYVTQVGSVQLLDGVPRKAIEFNSVCGASQWVEGIGEVESFLYSEAFCSLWDANPYYTRCFSTNGQLLYKRPDISGCYTSSINDLEMGAIHVFPNPGSERLYFEAGNEEEITNVQIYNCLGVLVLNTFSVLPQSNSIDISNLASGFHSGLVHFRNGKTKVFKLDVIK
jgi:Secretion system C-terminal sorting domain